MLSTCRCVTVPVVHNMGSISVHLRLRGMSSKGSKPDWQLEAEREARASQGHRGMKGSREGPNDGSAVNNVFLNSIKHEIKSEGISNTARLQGQLERQIQQLQETKLICKSQEDKNEYDSLRQTAIHTRNSLIIQREASGFIQDNSSTIESMFIIPKRI